MDDVCVDVTNGCELLREFSASFQAIDTAERPEVLASFRDMISGWKCRIHEGS